VSKNLSEGREALYQMICSLKSEDIHKVVSYVSFLRFVDVYKDKAMADLLRIEIAKGNQPDELQDSYQVQDSFHSVDDDSFQTQDSYHPVSDDSYQIQDPFHSAADDSVQTQESFHSVDDDLQELPAQEESPVEIVQEKKRVSGRVIFFEEEPELKPEPTYYVPLTEVSHNLTDTVTPSEEPSQEEFHQTELPQAELPQVELPGAELPQAELLHAELPQAELPPQEAPIYVEPDVSVQKLQRVVKKLRLKFTDVAFLFNISPTMARMRYLGADFFSAEEEMQLQFFLEVTDHVEKMGIPRFDQMLRYPLPDGEFFLEKLKDRKITNESLIILQKTAENFEELRRKFKGAAKPFHAMQDAIGMYATPLHCEG